MQTGHSNGSTPDSPDPAKAGAASAREWIERGDAATDLAQFDSAVDCYRQALECDPTSVKTLLNLGYALQALSRYAESLACYGQLLAIEPGNAKAFASRGVALLSIGRLTEALDSCEQALAADPGNPEAYFNAGFVLQELGRHADALTRYEQALAIRPDYPAALSNRGMSLQFLGRHDDALACFERTLAIDPESVEALANRGAALQDLGRYEDALASYDLAQRLRPDYADAHWNESLCRLRIGDFARGWQKYEWRWRTGHLGPMREFAQPLWLGETPIAGRTLLLHAEQGIGDTLQFCRYATRAAALGARVLLEVQPPLKSLLADLQGVSLLLARGEDLPPFDCHCPLLSLPLAFSKRMETIPSMPAYLRADPARVARWRGVLAPRSGLRVGLIWSGRADQPDDRNRSIPLAELLPLATAGTQLVGLQKDVRPADRVVLNERSDIRHFGEDFAETAALVELMDVVVSVDTSIAHLAGALGKPVWLLLPRNPDWRWLLGRDDSPWYPSARLFRQQSAGRWAPVIDEVARQLAGLAGAGNA